MAILERAGSPLVSIDRHQAGEGSARTSAATFARSKPAPPRPRSPASPDRGDHLMVRVPPTQSCNSR
jgi:hypothetical protein